jgi:hypothetical protein
MQAYGRLILTSSPEIDVMVALSGESFIESRPSFEQGNVAKHMKNAEGTVFERIASYNGFASVDVGEELRDQHIFELTYYSGESWEEDNVLGMIDFFASFGMGIKGEFSGEGEQWTYDVAFGSSKIVQDAMVSVRSRYLNTLELNTQLLDSIKLEIAGSKNAADELSGETLLAYLRNTKKTLPV